MRSAGAFPGEGGTRFVVWTTSAKQVEVRLFDGNGRVIRTAPLARAGEGWFDGRVGGVGVGALYKFVLDGRELPDPYARFLPLGVHGPAEVVSLPRAAPFAAAPRLDLYVIYEMHVGTFTEAGTYAAAAERLPALVDLGMTAVELMPLAAFPGKRGWGYDGVAGFAPFAPYGRPQDLRAFVDRAHALGLAVLVDVVFNHLGPRGNYLGEYAREYFTTKGGNPWGSTPDFARPEVRRYALDIARMWFDAYGFDGLRLDATHAIVDPSPKHILQELHDVARSYEPPKVLIAEDERNEPGLVTNGFVDAVWADDFHHQMRVLLTGERDGYYGAYEPTLEALARAVERGWTYEGQTYPPWGRARGQPAGALAAPQLVYCVQNHDQVGNRALGTRLDADAGVGALLAATLVLLFLPRTPLLFMGQEWAVSSPFLFFTDHDAEYGPLVSKGRREEFAGFRAFADPEGRAAIPDPQAEGTFRRSKLRWEERAREPHAGVLAAVRAMTALRRDDAVLGSAGGACTARVVGGLLVVERAGERERRALVANLSGKTVQRGDDVPRGRVLFSVGAASDGAVGPFAVAVLDPAS